jgi:hypothetical protein
MIKERYPEKIVRGVDIAQNVLDALKKKKQREQRTWDVVFGDVLNLGQYIEKGSVDTIIYCSILHELSEEDHPFFIRRRDGISGTVCEGL